MILYALAAAVLAAAQPDPAAGQPSAGPPPADDPVATLAQLNDFYAQTCQVKAYASYDDICHAVRDQIHEAERAADKVAKDRAKAEKLAGKSKPPAKPADTATTTEALH